MLFRLSTGPAGHSATCSRDWRVTLRRSTAAKSYTTSPHNHFTNPHHNAAALGRSDRSSLSGQTFSMLNVVVGLEHHCSSTLSPGKVF